MGAVVVEDAKLDRIYEKVEGITGRVNHIEAIMSVYVRNQEKTNELLEKMAAQQEINAANGRRVGKLESDMTELHRDMIANQVSSKINTAKISGAMTFVTALIMMALKEFFSKQ